MKDKLIQKPGSVSWLSSGIGFIIGVLAFLVTILLDWVTTELELGNLLSLAIYFFVAGIVMAIASVRPLRKLLTQRNDSLGDTRRTLSACTAAVAVLAAIVFLVNPRFPMRWLFYWYAVILILDWLAWRWILQGDFGSPRSPHAASIAAYFDQMPHAPFVIVGLFLLVITPVYLLLNQNLAAERTANWAFGFLVIGVGVALSQLFTLPGRAMEWFYRMATVVLAIFAIFFVGVGFASESARTPEENSFLIDTFPSFVSGRLEEYKDKAIVISDSPRLRLSNIQGASPNFDSVPDQRGLALWDDLIRVMQGKRRAYWIIVPNKTHDTQGLLATFLKSNGCLDEAPGTILPVKPFELRSPLVKPHVLPPTLANRVPDAFDPIQVDFGAIQIAGLRFEPTMCNHDAIAVAIRWRLPQPTTEPLKVSFSLFDAKGRLVQSQDFFIDDLADKHTDAWVKDSQVAGYYLLPVPFGTPPGNYGISLSVYAESNSQRLRVNNATGVAASWGDSVSLGVVNVYRADDVKSDPYKTLQDLNFTQARVDMRDGLRLVSYNVAGTSVVPGENVSLILRWRALLNSLPSYIVRVRLKQGEKIIAESSGTPVDGTYPTSQWKIDEQVIDRWDLRVPPDVAGGKAQLEIGVDGGRTLYVADVNIAQVAHNFQAPAMTTKTAVSFVGIGDLIGYDLAKTNVTPNDKIGLTLYWRATASTIDRNYVVFAQMLAADGRLIGQSDSVPANGERPTRGWVNSEIIVDRHELGFQDANYRGDATLIVGMYDPATGKRVLLKDSSNDSFRLLTVIRVVNP